MAAKSARLRLSGCRFLAIPGFLFLLLILFLGFLSLNINAKVYIKKGFLPPQKIEVSKNKKVDNSRQLYHSQGAPIGGLQSRCSCIRIAVNSMVVLPAIDRPLPLPSATDFLPPPELPGSGPDCRSRICHRHCRCHCRQVAQGRASLRHAWHGSTELQQWLEVCCCRRHCRRSV